MTSFPSFEQIFIMQIKRMVLMSQTHKKYQFIMIIIEKIKTNCIVLLNFWRVIFAFAFINLFMLYFEMKTCS